jgi:hypothetical protein
MLGGFYEFASQNVDKIIWDPGLKKYLGLALLTNNFPPKKIKIRDDVDYINKSCYGQRAILAIDYAALILHESCHWHQFIKTGKSDESYPQYTEARFMEVLSRKLHNKPFVITVPSLDGQRPWTIQYVGNPSKAAKSFK